MNSASRHLARGHGELAVLHRAGAADMAVDRHVVGRIGEDHLRQVAAEQPLVASSASSASPQISRCSPRMPEVARTA